MSPKDPPNPLPQPREEVLHRPAHPLLDGALVERTQLAGDLVTLLEVLGVDRAAVDRAEVRDAAQRSAVDAES